jgi:uncharacterized protein YndB with AHSA1/START domain
MAEYETSIDIDAPPETVFDLLVTADGLTAWLGQFADVEPVPGGRFVVDVGGMPIRGEYVRVDPPRRVVLTWGSAGSADHPPGSSTVEITLTATPTGTLLQLVHRDLPAVEEPHYAAGWPHFLSRLLAHLARR